jgi:hypothetical protein
MAKKSIAAASPSKSMENAKSRSLKPATSGPTATKNEMSDCDNPNARNRALRWFSIMAVIYTAWLFWLLYVGLVNYRAGNQ